MGTRSMTYVLEDKQPVAVIYRQMDGYPTGQGQDIKDALAGRRLVNGFTLGDNTQINGMGDVAATLVAKLKDPTVPGSIYMCAADDKIDWCEFIYRVWGKDGQIMLTCSTPGEQDVLYTGRLDKFDPIETEAEYMK